MPPGRFVAGVILRHLSVKFRSAGFVFPGGMLMFGRDAGTCPLWEDHEAYLQASTMAYVQQTS